MKLDALIVLSKGLAYVVVGVFGPWVAALAQWANSGLEPPKIIWLGVIFPLSMIGAGNAWIAFTSGSWTAYREQSKANITGQEQVTTVKPSIATADIPQHL